MLKGRYGPYVTDKKKNAKAPKDRDPASLTLEECQALIAAAPERKGRFGRFGRRKAAATTGDDATTAPGCKAAAPRRKAAAPQGRDAEGGEAQGRKEKSRREESPRQGRARRRVTHG